MKVRTFAELGLIAAATVVLRRRNPLVGSLILTDRCNLACQHCAVANIRRTNYPYSSICADLATLHRSGVRILFLYGGEPFLWRDHDRDIRDVVAAARDIGFLMVNVVTNGTQGLDLPGVDLMMVSLDGDREHHDLIRGRTYDRILANIAAAPTSNICLYMAINTLNVGQLEAVCRTARDLATVRAVAFNFHTPYPRTEHLSLTREQKRDCVARITRARAEGFPVMDLVSVLPDIAEGTHTGPCRQCVIMEDGQTWTCGRCIEVPGLCQECGFFFAAELSALFSGRPRVVLDAVRTYGALL